MPWTMPDHQRVEDRDQPTAPGSEIHIRWVAFIFVAHGQDLLLALAVEALVVATKIQRLMKHRSVATHPTFK